MAFFGKLLGAIFGNWMAGPVGLILGVVVGHLFDKGLQLNLYIRVPHPEQAQTTFLHTTFSLMGYLAKLDGRVSEKEIQIARHIMAQLGLTLSQRQFAMQAFNEGKSNEFNWHGVVNDFMQECMHSSHFSQNLIESLLHIARVDGPLDGNKRHVLIQLCQRLNISSAFLEGTQSHYRYDNRATSYESELDQAYKILGVTAHTPKNEIKKAYRVLMSQHHPDKLTAQGKSEAAIKKATQTTQRIQKAYEVICKANPI